MKVNYALRVGQFAGSNDSHREKYRYFYIMDFHTKLIIIRSSIGDSLLYHDGMAFTTRDVEGPDGQCARDSRGAWW